MSNVEAVLLIQRRLSIMKNECQPVSPFVLHIKSPTYPGDGLLLTLTVALVPALAPGG
jgi:hypothetical protein